MDTRTLRPNNCTSADCNTGDVLQGWKTPESLQGWFSVGQVEAPLRAAASPPFLTFLILVFVSSFLFISETASKLLKIPQVVNTKEDRDAIVRKMFELPVGP